MVDRRVNNRSGHLYSSDLYDDIEAPLEREFGLPVGGMKAIRVKGERSNADQVSSVGARTVYQITPETRKLIQDKYKFDPWANERNAARGSAIVLRDGMRITGSWNGAVRHYVGGQGPASAENQATRAAYAARVTGTPADQQVTPDQLRKRVQQARMAAVGQFETPIPSVQKLVTAGLAAQAPKTAIAYSTAPDASVEVGQAKANVAEERKRSQVSFFDSVMASVDKNWTYQAVVRGMEQENLPDDPNYRDWYINNMQEVESFAQTPQERAMLRDTGSEAQRQQTMKTILGNRERDRVINASGHGLSAELIGAFTDPVTLLATAGLGKVFQGGAKGFGLARAALEGSAANLAFTGVQDYSGNYQTAQDYVINGAAGLAMGALLWPVTSRSSRVADLSDAADIEAARVGQVTAREALRTEARTQLPETAAPEQVEARATQIEGQQAKDWMDIALSDVGDENKILTADEGAMLTADPKVRAQVVQSAGLDAISDDAERGLAAEMHSRALRDNEVNPIDEAGLQGKVLRLAGQESSSITMARSKSPILNWVSKHLGENTTGAAGRNRTAAISQVAAERRAMTDVIEYDQLLDQFRKQRGQGWFSGEFFTQTLRREFDDRIHAEREFRANNPTGNLDSNPLVRRAADMFDEGYANMATEAKRVGTLGSDALNIGRGYQPRNVDPRKVHALAPEGSEMRRNLDRVVSRQLQRDNEYTFVAREDGKDWLKGETVTRKFDKKFSDQLARDYWTKALDRGNGMYHVPVDIHSSESADIISEALEAMKGIDPAEKEALIQKFSRGGSGYTKGRLKLDLNEEVGNGLRLGDFFMKDQIGLYRTYSRRISGEIALAQYGVMGVKGMKLIRQLAARTGASGTDLEAFDQLTSELLNTPFGLAKRHPWMNDLRAATSAARLGGMLFPQLGEWGNGLAAVGIRGVMHGIKDIPKMIGDVGRLKKGLVSKNPILSSIDTLGGNLGMDNYYMTRMFDVKDNAVDMFNDHSIGVVSRTIRAGSHAVAVASGHRVMVAAQTRSMAEQIVRKAVRYVKEGTESQALRDMGISTSVEATLRRNMDRIAKFDSKGELQELDLMAAQGDLGDIMAFRDAIERGAGQIIQREYPGELGPWAHNDLLRLLFQFRTFGLTSIEKQWGRNMTNYGAVRSFGILMASMSFAVPIHLARIELASVGMSRKEREKYLEERMSVAALSRATLNYASASGLLGDFYDVGASTIASSGILDPDAAKALTASGLGRQSSSGLVPAIGFADDVLKGTVGGDYSRMLKVVPGNNWPFVTPLVHQLTPDKE